MLRARLLIVAFLASCAHEQGPALTAPAPPIRTDSQPAAAEPVLITASAAPKDTRPDEVGLATWYGSRFASKKTANGERFDPSAMTAAHRHLPFGTWVEVRRPDTGHSIRVRINDRGPWGDSRRVIDLSQAAAQKLGVLGLGVAPVELRVLRPP